MTTDTAAPSYKGFRFPQEIIAHAVWLYFRFNLSYRDVEELLAERGVIVTYESVRQWCLKFGQMYANALRRRRPKPGDKWHLDEVFLKINDIRHYHDSIDNLRQGRYRRRKLCNPQHVSITIS